MSTNAALANAGAGLVHPDLAQGDGFFALCASLCNRADDSPVQSDAPLRGRLKLRSRVLPSFHPNDYSVHAEIKPGVANLDVVLTAQLSFLTLAGTDGALPWWITEKIMWDRHGDGQALHVFLDVLNRRFWELLYLSQCVGSSPQYGVYKQQHAQLLGQLSYAAAGISFENASQRASSALSEPQLLHDLQQYCWTAGSGMGGAAALAQLLTGCLGKTVTLQEYLPVRLEVAGLTRLCIGRQGNSRLSSARSVVGSKAWVACGLRMTVHGIQSEDLDQFLPLNQGKYLSKLRQVVEICYFQNLPPLMLALNCAPNKNTATLGSKSTRLGWGACIATPRAVSQMLQISRRAVANYIL